MAEHRAVDPAVAKLEAGHEELGRRIGGLEKGFGIFQGEVHSSFSELKSMISTINARPTFNVHETIRTVQSLGLTVGLIVGGIIWIVNGSFSGMIAEQKALNHAVVERLKEQKADIDRLAERTQWLPSAPKRN